MKDPLLYTPQVNVRLSAHANVLVVKLMVQPDNRRLRTHLSNICLPGPKYNCLIHCIFCKVKFVSLLLTNYNWSISYQLQRSTTEHSSTCHGINF
jgi:hypothetical protein